jgi:hypothetical protein
MFLSHNLGENRLEGGHMTSTQIEADFLVLTYEEIRQSNNPRP